MIFIKAERRTILCIQLLVKYQLKYRKGGGPGRGSWKSTAISRVKFGTEYWPVFIGMGWRGILRHSFLMREREEI